MRRPQMLFGALWVSALLLAACGNPERADAPAPGDPVTAAPAGPIAGPGERLVPMPTAEAGRPFLRVNLDKLEWKPIEGDTSGVQQVVVEGNPSKPGYYLVINKFPPGDDEPASLSSRRAPCHRVQGNVVHGRRRRLQAERDGAVEAGRLHASPRGRPPL